MSAPIEQLVREHDLILRVLRALERLTDRLEGGENLSPDLFLRAADFIQNFADRYHHAKEEDILFKWMGERGVPVQGGPIGVMLYEHTLGRQYRQGLETGARKLQQGNPEGVAEIAENARGFIQLLSQHILKENNVLYPMAERVIPQSDMARMAEAFNEVRKEVRGEQVEETYRRLADELEAAANS